MGCLPACAVACRVRQAAWSLIGLIGLIGLIMLIGPIRLMSASNPSNAILSLLLSSAASVQPCGACQRVGDCVALFCHVWRFVSYPGACYTCIRVCMSVPSSNMLLPFRFSFTSSIRKFTYIFFGENLFTRLYAAFIVPPVASRSS